MRLQHGLYIKISAKILPDSFPKAQPFVTLCISNHFPNPELVQLCLKVSGEKESKSIKHLKTITDLERESC